MNIYDKSKKNGYEIVKQDELYRIYHNGSLISIKGVPEMVFNAVIDLKSYVKDIAKIENGFKITGAFQSRFLDANLQEAQIKVNVDGNLIPVSIVEMLSKDGIHHYTFECELDISRMQFKTKSSAIAIIIEDFDSEYQCFHTIGFKNLKSADKLYNKKNFKQYYSPIYRIDGDSVYLYQNANNKLCIVRRETFKTDSPAEAKKIKWAYRLSKIARILPSYRGPVFFEKFTQKYEESASIIFEKFVDDGYKNAHFIIDENSIHYGNIPNRYMSNVVKKYSFKHYVLLFSSKTFLATESMNHIIDLNVANGYIRRKIDQTKYRYYFLQHGVMYMYALKGRKAFQYGGWGFGDNVKIVASSSLEKEHFVEDGHFKRSQILVTGLPKFDRAYRMPNADKIAIMPTSRDFEYNVIRQTPKESTYYKFLKGILDNIPENLKDKVVVLPHPLIKNCFNDTEISKYIPNEWIYDEVLKSVDTFITDYSSASYDAYYRGCNVIFAWEHKDMCLEKLGYGLMLDENNAFGDISFDFSDIGRLIEANYGTNRRRFYLEKYKNIVQYDDNQNTQRCFDAILKDLKDRKKVSIRKTRISRLPALDYCNKSCRFKRIHLTHGDKFLVEGVDYSVKYLINWKRGVNLMLIIGKGKYIGIKPKFFKIKDNIGKFDFGKLSGNLQGELTDYDIRHKDKKMKADVDFVVNEIDFDDWENNPNLGYPDYVRAELKGKGKFRGKQTVYYRLDK